MEKGDKYSCIIKYDYKETFKELGPEKTYQLVMAMIAYDEAGTAPDFTGELKLAWIPIRQDLDKNRAKWEKTSEERAKAGAQGGRGNKKEESKKSKESNCFNEKQSKAKKANKAEYDCDCDTDSDLKRENLTTTERAGAEEQDDLPGPVAIESYTRFFGAPSDKQIGEMAALAMEYDKWRLWTALRIAGKRSPPPDNPIMYMRTVIATLDEECHTNIKLSMTPELAADQERYNAMGGGP